MSEIENGICLIAYGEKARLNALQCIDSIRRVYKKMPITVFTDEKLDTKQAESIVSVPNTGDEIVDYTIASRVQKLSLVTATPYKHTLYMDVDCRVDMECDILWDALADGFEMVIAPSTVQGERWGQHATEDDRVFTLDMIGFTPLQMQCGVFSFRRTPRIRSLFAQWRKEYGLYGRVDQLAFSRALYQKGIKLHIVSNVFNGGSCIRHLFGALR